LKESHIDMVLIVDRLITWCWIMQIQLRRFREPWQPREAATRVT